MRTPPLRGCGQLGKCRDDWDATHSHKMWIFVAVSPETFSIVVHYSTFVCLSRIENVSLVPSMWSDPDVKHDS